jgi:5'-nucleotidase
MRVARGLFLVGALVVAAASQASAQSIDVLVTNDDGIGAAGIDAVVEELRLNANLNVIVVAPATNQSGTGDNFTTGSPIGVAAGTTASGFGGTAVSGYPADSVLYAVVGAGLTPDIVVSGINNGQNLGREIGTELSGTVGAALTAARLGIPAIAVSAQLAQNDYAAAATYTANVVENFRVKKTLGKKLTNKNGLGTFAILNINVPSCNLSGGSLRGVELVPVAQVTTVTGYTEGAPGLFTATTSTLPVLGGGNCLSTLEDPAHDIAAFTNGFISLTALNPDLTVDNKLKRFKFLTKIPFN